MKQTIIIIAFILLLTTSRVDGQTVSGEENDRLTKGQEIINQARKAIDKGNVLKALKSFYINIDKTPPGEALYGTEISITLPDKIRVTDNLVGFKVFRTVSGGKFSEDSQMTLDGETMPSLRQMGGQPVKPSMPSYIEENVSKERSDYLKENPDELNKLLMESRLWSDIFPILLFNPLNSDVKYEYVGKAESASQRADIVDVKSNFYRKIRLFFDEKTHLLLMMTVRIDTKQLASTDKYYYSDYQLTDGLLIAKSVKCENDQVSKDENRKKTYNPTPPVIKEVKINSNLKVN